MMEGRGCRDVIWGRKGLQVLWRGGHPVHGERERDREDHIEDCTKENTSPKPLTKKTRGADYPEFLQPAELKA